MFVAVSSTKCLKARIGESNKEYGVGSNVGGGHEAASKDAFTQGLSRWGLSTDERSKRKVGFGIKHPRPVYQPAELSGALKLRKDYWVKLTN